MTDQVNELRKRVAHLRIARQVATEYQIQAPKQVRGPLGAFIRWLDDQERRATEFGQSLVKQRSEAP
jgi:hypothetical protein